MVIQVQQNEWVGIIHWIKAPDQIDILPPKQCNTKGSGKRIKGGKEKVMEQQGKRLRLCKACGEQAYHDSRNCPTKLSS